MGADAEGGEESGTGEGTVRTIPMIVSSVDALRVMKHSIVEIITAMSVL